MRAAIIFLLVGCAACVSATGYPNDWPQPGLADIGCPNISGTYTDAGLSASAPDRTGDDPEGDLSRYFFDYEKSEIASTRQKLGLCGERRAYTTAHVITSTLSRRAMPVHQRPFITLAIMKLIAVLWRSHDRNAAALL